MKLKELLSEGLGPCAGCDDIDCECHGSTDEGDPEACPGCGRKPGDGYGADCDDPQGCGYWKDWAKEAMAELRRDMKADGAVEEAATFFDRYMEETLQLEERRARVNKAPVMAEGYGKVRQKRVQELPLNRIRVGVK